jgi:two-component system nitrogen regulation sensor histidine kinase NtrY
MRLAYKITLLLFLVVSLFIVITSLYFYSQINRDFTRRSEDLMAQTAASLEMRIDLLKNALNTEVETLSSSLFSENEATIAAMLAKQPDLNSDVIGFAERLRRRTTLNFLYLISSNGTILSESLHPARYGKSDPLPDFPLDKSALVFEESSCLELKRRATFGQREIYVRGGFFLKEELQRMIPSQLKIDISEIDPLSPSVTKPGYAYDSNYMTKTITLKDYLSRPIVQITVAVSREQLNTEKQKLIRNSLLWIAGALVFCLLTGFALSLSITRPVARLRDAASQMASGNLDVRIAEQEGGEVGELVKAFNHMAEHLQENQKRLIQTERIAAWQEIARHLAHEIKNPLMPIRTSLANLRLCMEKAPEKFSEIFPESSQSILEEVERLRHLADEFSRFARLPAPILKKGNLNFVIQKCVALYSGDSNSAIRFEPGVIPEFSFDTEQISEVIHNLLQNAVDAISSNGMIRVSTSIVQEQHRQWIRLIVEDNGKGMDENTRRQIFTPYFTTKQTGTGLGLAIVHRIVTEHAGKIFLESGPEKGSKFEVLLPVS